MSSYQIDLQGDVLRVGFSKHIRATGDRVVKDTLIKLEQMQAELKGGKLLKIDGPQSIAVAYTIAHQLAHRYGAIAIFDPKIGRVGYKTYIVAISHDPDYQIGDLVETAEPQTDRNSVKIVLCGPPNSGKSCLREGLKWQIMELIDAPYPYVISACPDGEPAGIQEISRRDPIVARDIKQVYKGDLTLEYAEKIAEAVRNTNNAISIIDVGGKISPENQLIFQECTHAIILAGDSQNLHHTEHWQKWESFCERSNLPVIAKIHSDYHATSDRLDTKQPLLTGMIHYLSRGSDISDREMLKALAKLVVQLTSS